MSKFPNNMKRVIFLTLVAGGVLHLARAEEKSSLPPPTSPVLPRAGDIAAWTIQFSYDKRTKDAATQAAPAQDQIKSLSIRKTKKIYSIIAEWQSGKISEKWNIDGLQLQTAPDSSVVALLPKPESPDFDQPDYADFSRTDFPELAWLSMENFRGTETYKGKPCYFFVREEGGKKITAKLSDRQLPLEIVSDEAVVVYTMVPPPAAPLTPPENFLQALMAYQRGREALKRQPSPP